MNRKPTKNTRGPDANEKRFQGWLKEHDCILTNSYGVEVHHCLGSTAKQDKVLIGHYFCIPLTPDLHRQYHSGSKTWRDVYGLQSTLWLDLAFEYSSETGIEIPDDVKLAIYRTNK